jgi:hypothetical protein
MGLLAQALRRQLWDLLSYLLTTNKDTYTALAVEEGAWRRDVKKGDLSKRLSELKQELEAIKFPWYWHVNREGQVKRDNMDLGPTNKTGTA